MSKTRNFNYFDEEKFEKEFDNIMNEFGTRRYEYFESQLLPCPFCGSKKVHLSKNWPYDPYCQDCGAEIHLLYPDTTINDAVKCWNRRAKS